MTLAFTFPGQGSQFVGMGQALAQAFPSAKAVFAEVNDALSQSLSDLMWDGPMETLTLTANTQPALMACSVAAIRALKAEFDVDITQAQYIAGHSLGEYSALCAADAISLADTARLLRIRGNAMQKAVPVGSGAMAALLGASLDDAEAAAQAGRSQGICQIANDNATGQIVLSGETAAVEAAAVYARENGVKKAVILPVSAPFHCDMMAPAAQAMQEALAETDISAPRVALVNNVTARPTLDPDQIRTDLVTQVTGRVRWRETIIWMFENGVSQMQEPGCGKVLTVMRRRIVKEITGGTLDTAEKLEAFANAVKG